MQAIAIALQTAAEAARCTAARHVATQEKAAACAEAEPDTETDAVGWQRRWTAPHTDSGARG